jgi:hypothetical protein
MAILITLLVEDVGEYAEVTRACPKLKVDHVEMPDGTAIPIMPS